MQLFNHYSVLIVGALFVLGGLAIVLRRGGRALDWGLLVAFVLVIGAAWFVARPVARAAQATDKPVLLMLQSPYCLGCVALKPSVDRFEEEMRDRLVVRRVDIQSGEGAALFRQHGVQFTPTYILFDPTGAERWRGTGKLDAEAVKQEVERGNAKEER